jgi:hypothetical protein
MLLVFSLKEILNRPFDSMADSVRSVNRIASFVFSALLYKVSALFQMTADDIQHSHIEGGLYGSEEVAHENKVLVGVLPVELVLMGQEIIETVVICHLLQVIDLPYLQN